MFNHCQDQTNAGWAPFGGRLGADWTLIGRRLDADRDFEGAADPKRID